MRRLLAGLVFGAGLALAGNAFAADFYVVGLSEKNITILELDTVSRSGDIVTAWYVMAPPKPMTGEIELDYFVNKAEFDCAGFRLRNLTMTVYRPDGSVVTPSADDAWKDVPRETNYGGLVEAGCDPKTRDPENVWTGSRLELIALYRARQ